MILSILIPTIVGREAKCRHLQGWIKAQCEGRNAEVITLCDNKEMSIGVKRRRLLNMCNGEYCVFIDDDDEIPGNYVERVLLALVSKPDCVGYLESVVINGKCTIACHSNRFHDWGAWTKGFELERTIFCKDPIKTEIARKIGFSDLRFGEDHDFSRRLKSSGLLKTEVFINDIMYYYEGKILTQEQHNERYGIQIAK